MKIYAVFTIILSVASAENRVRVTPSPEALVKEGESLDLQCDYTGSSKPSFIVWYLNDDRFGLVIDARNCSYITEPVVYATKRYKLSCRKTSFTLSITNISKAEDNGVKWECEIEIFGLNGLINASTKIRVTEAVKTNGDIEGFGEASRGELKIIFGVMGPLVYTAAAVVVVYLG